jgi:hypothetical protein
MKSAMKRILGALAGALVLAACASGPAGTGWITLIDGDQGMENWDVTGGANWRAEGGAIQADRIGLQFNAGPIKFRRLLVREL